VDLLTNVPITLSSAAVLAFCMAWAIGANDAANAMGTSFGSGESGVQANS